MKRFKKLAFILYEQHFVRYIVVGGSTFILDFSTLIYLHTNAKLSITLATSLAYLTSVLYNFILNRFWAFDAREKASLKRHMLAYLIMNAFNFFFTLAAVSILSQHINYVTAKVLAAISAVPWTYIIYRDYIFVKRSPSAASKMSQHNSSDSIEY